MATILIGGKQYDSAYANDPKNQEEIRQAVVGSGNNIYTTSGSSLVNNATGATVKSNPNGQMTSTGSTYTTSNGSRVTPYSQGNAVGAVAADSVHDINNPNTYNAKVANSHGKISLLNEGDYDNNGVFTGASSGTNSETASQAYYDNIRNGGNNSGNGGSSYNAILGGASTSNSSYGQNASINSLKEYQKQQAMAELGKARDTSLSNLGAEKAAIQPAYYKSREQTSTASQLGAKNLAEYMASRGQTNAGASTQGELNRNVALQSNIGALNQQEQGELNTNARRVTDTNNAYNSDVASANAGIEASAMQQQIQANQLAEAQRIAQANADRDYYYQINRDTVGDNRYNTETKYNQDRDSLADVKWATEGNYRAEQDRINQTGQLGDGTYTQSGLSNSLNIQQQQAQLEEMQNPNSTTNQMARLGLDTAKLNYAALPAQLKTQAQLIAQQLSRGAIDNKTAQLQLDYLPKQMQAELNQTYAQTSAANRSNQGSSSSSAAATTKSNQTSALADATKTLLSRMAVGEGSKWLQTYQGDLIDNLGVTGYNSLVKNTYNKAVDDQGLAKANKALRNAGE